MFRRTWRLGGAKACAAGTSGGRREHLSPVSRCNGRCVAAGVEVLLDDLTDADVLGLNLVAEGQGFGGGFTPKIFLRQVPLENGQRALWTERKDDIQGNVIGVAVEHPVGKDPEIIGGQILAGGFAGLLVAPGNSVPGLSAADRGPLA